jgi:hypothetical protein
MTTLRRKPKSTHIRYSGRILRKLKFSWQILEINPCIKFPENSYNGSDFDCRKIAKSNSFPNAPKPYVVDYSSSFCGRKHCFIFLEILGSCYRVLFGILDVLWPSVFWIIWFVSDDRVHSVCIVHKLAFSLFTVMLRILPGLCVSTG